MKKLMILLSLSLFAFDAMAQDAFFKGSLDDAMNEAKAKNKTILVIASATW